MPYIFTLIFAAGFCSGFFVEYQISKAEIQHYELSIKAQRDSAEALLKAKTDEVTNATASAIKSNSDLDASHVSTINALNSLRDSFATRGLRDSGSRQGCTVALSASNRPGLPERTSDTGQLSAEFAGFLRRESYRADRAAELYAKCREFAYVNNCGIAR